ncbi:MAG: acetyl-CoA carboxylase biotin carboxyl carrier protein, partial [Acidobacteria bacterium]
MDLKEIKQLIRLVDEKKFAEFELEQGDFRLRIKRNEMPIIQHAGESLTVEPEPISTSDNDAEHSLTAVASAATPAMDEEAVETDLHVVTSPIVGTFYRAPSPTADPFVR